jgi:hypothetical protein
MGNAYSRYGADNDGKGRDLVAIETRAIAEKKVLVECEV